MGDGGKRERERKRTRRQSCWRKQGEVRRGEARRGEARRGKARERQDEHSRCLT